MGYDRIGYFEGTDAETTLISGDKQSAHVVYGYGLQSFLGKLGFKSQLVVDRKDVAVRAQSKNRIDAEIKDLPEHTKTRFTTGCEFVEVSPPLDEAMTRVINAYFETHCQPTDAGMIIDYRERPPKVIGGF
jgi:hypothetical protein